MKKANEDKPTDEIVRAAQKGDRAAQTELFKLTQDDLFRFCFYLCGDPILAQDLAQESFVRALESLKKLKDVSSFKSWLLRSAKNLFLDHLKSHKNRPTLDLEDIRDKVAIEGNEPDLVLQVRQTFASLSVEERLILLLVDHEKYSYAEAGQILGLSEDVVTTRVFRARQAFLKNFK